MKKYKRPIIQQEIESDINEEIFLSGSGWSNSDCWVGGVKYTGNIVWDDDGHGARITCQLNGRHKDNVHHHCYAEYLIFTFPNGSANVAAYHGDLNGDLNQMSALGWDVNGNKARCVARYHGNDGESIGSGALFLYVSNLTTAYDAEEFASYLPSDCAVYDNLWRCAISEHDSVCEQSGHW